MKKKILMARICLAAGILIFLVELTLQLPAFHVHRTIPASIIRHEQEHVYKIDLRQLESREKGNLPFVVFAGDGLENNDRSLLKLYEDGVLQEMRHSVHESLMAIGMGRHSHWGKYLIFSTSDNSNPIENGRTYSISVPFSINQEILQLMAIMLIASLLFLMGGGSFRPLPKTVAEIWTSWRKPCIPLASPSPSFPNLMAVIAGIPLAWAIMFFWGTSIPIFEHGLMNPILQSGLVIIPFLMAGTIAGKPHEKWTIPILLCLATVLFHLPLLDNWRGENSSWGFFIPTSDANAYYMGGLGVLETGHLDFWNQRRPITSVLTALRLWLSGGDLRMALALQASLIAVAVLFAAQQLSRRLGLAATMLFVLLCGVFITPYMPTTLSETTGFFFGAMALGFLWRGLEDKSPKVFSFGMFCLALGLYARAGTFLLLPAALAWAFLFHKGRDRLTWCGYVLAGIAGATIVNWLYLKILGTGANIPNSNFSTVLYGMSLGGKGWAQIGMDHPELTHETPENVRAIYDLAIANILQQPSLFISYLWRQLVAAPGYVMHLPGKNIYAFSICGLLFLLATALARKSAFLIFMLLGIIFSAPLLMQDGGKRVFAASIPILAVFPSISIYFIQTMLKKLRHADSPITIHAKTSKNMDLYAISIGVAGYVLIPLFFAGGVQKMQKIAPDSCPSGQTSVPFIREYATILRIHAPDKHVFSYAPDVDVDVYTKNWKSSPTDDHTPPFSIISFYRNMEKGMPYNQGVLENSLWKPEKGKTYVLCLDEMNLTTPSSLLKILSIQELRE
ncbi:MAG TPA: hypothetical protein DCW68_04975 [Rhodospirillaceae bacterium]|nr:MAG: hypothetical protein A2018_02670 [Alphaproteobacteria bacterium GWF2_58_20]HAU29449.1 hypothetical protein [Rhodospirillaceae bacterium]